MKLFFCILICTASLAFAQTTPALKASAAKTSNSNSTTAQQNPRQKFVLDVVHSAVGLQEADLQDRLRVLFAAANVVAPIDKAMAHEFAKQGIAIETKLVAEGQKPAVSMLAGGHVDCSSAVTFVQTVPPSAVLEAEQSILAAITLCPAQVEQPAKEKLDSGLNQGSVAARPILALMDAPKGK